MREKTWAAAVVLALGGCAHLHDGPLYPDLPEPPKICREIAVAEPVDPDEACPPWRRVALLNRPQDVCPVPGPVDGKEWTVSRLFAAPAAGPAAALPPALSGFCLYLHEENEPEPVMKRLNRELDRLVGARSAFARIDDGCAAVGPAGTDDSSSDPGPWQEMEEYFLRQVGDVEPVTVLGPDAAAEVYSEPRVKLSFLDTQPTGRWDDDVNSRHGYSLAQIARRIVCDESGATAGRCTAELDSRLALPIERFIRGEPESTTTNWVRGGYSGSVDFLAAAVWDAVRDQRPGQHLVLNLSVAWDGEVFGGLEDEVAQMPVPVQAFYRALEVASCRGALVVAAAGNLREGPGNEEGPLLPGGWERRDAPDAERCRAVLGDEGSPPAGDSREPLVYAAGGVRFDNSPLSNSRPGGTPPRVTYASHALADWKSPRPLTGSSVATAVVSATASVVWHHWPDLARGELMALLYRAGSPVGRPAELYHPSWRRPPEVRRVAVCPALARACDELGGACPPACEELSEPPEWCWSVRPCSKPVKTIDALKIDQVLADVPFCGERTIFYDPAAGVPTDPCVSEQFYEAAAWAWQESTLPQPEEDPCSACGPSGGSKGNLAGVSAKGLECPTSGARGLWIQIDDDWQKPLSQAFLDVGDYSLALGVGELTGGDCALVENVDLERFPDLDGNPYVILRFRTEDRRVISIPVQF